MVSEGLMRSGSSFRRPNDNAVPGNRKGRLRIQGGSAVVELAICLPILMTVLLATTEACNMLHVQQSLKICAFEGARVGTVPGADASNVAFQCQTLLDDHNVQDFTITMDPPDPTALNQGDYFQVTVSADFNSNSLIGGWLYNGRTLSRSVALRAE